MLWKSSVTITLKVVTDYFKTFDHSVSYFSDEWESNAYHWNHAGEMLLYCLKLLYLEMVWRDMHMGVPTVADQIPSFSKHLSFVFINYNLCNVVVNKQSGLYYSTKTQILQEKGIGNVLPWNRSRGLFCIIICNRMLYIATIYQIWAFGVGHFVFTP